MKKHLEAHSRFLHEYGSDGYMIIAAYEEACGVRQDGRYADWFGDLGLFEASGNEEATYEKLCERYAAGLKYLGIIREQAEAVCCAFVSSQLAEHIREEMDKSAADSGYMPKSVLSKRHVFELTAEQLAVDAEMDVDCDIGQEITAHLETWFDVDKKFGLDITDEDGTWLNLYAKYNPFADTLRLECEISRDNGSVYFDYEPTPGRGAAHQGHDSRKNHAGAWTDAAGILQRLQSRRKKRLCVYQHSRFQHGTVGKAEASESLLCGKGILERRKCQYICANVPMRHGIQMYDRLLPHPGNIQNFSGQHAGYRQYA